MGKHNNSSKGKGGGGSSSGPSTEPAVRSDVAAAARRRSKSGQAFPWQVSLLVLVAAVGLTYFFTRSPSTPPVPGSTRRAASASSDPEFQPQTRDQQCTSWKRDGECDNSAPPPPPPGHEEE